MMQYFHEKSIDVQIKRWRSKKACDSSDDIMAELPESLWALLGCSYPRLFDAWMPRLKMGPASAQ